MSGIDTQYRDVQHLDALPMPDMALADGAFQSRRLLAQTDAASRASAPTLPSGGEPPLVLIRIPAEVQKAAPPNNPVSGLLDIGQSLLQGRGLPTYGPSPRQRLADALQAMGVPMQSFQGNAVFGLPQASARDAEISGRIFANAADNAGLYNEPAPEGANAAFRKGMADQRTMNQTLAGAGLLTGVLDILDPISAARSGRSQSAQEGGSPGRQPRWMSPPTPEQLRSAATQNRTIDEKVAELNPSPGGGYRTESALPRQQRGGTQAPSPETADAGTTGKGAAANPPGRLTQPTPTTGAGQGGQAAAGLAADRGVIRTFVEAVDGGRVGTVPLDRIVETGNRLIATGALPPADVKQLQQSINRAGELVASNDRQQKADIALVDRFVAASDKGKAGDVPLPRIEAAAKRLADAGVIDAQSAKSLAERIAVADQPKPTGNAISQTVKASGSPVEDYARRTGTWDGGNRINPQPEGELDPQFPVRTGAGGQNPSSQPLLPPAGGLVQRPPADAARQQQATDINPMLTVGRTQPTIGPEPFDSLGQRRTMTIGTFDNQPPSTQEAFVQLLQNGNSLAYGSKSSAQVAEALRDANQIASVVLDQPVPIAAGTTLKDFVVVPPGTVIPAGTVFPANVTSGDATLQAGVPVAADTALSSTTTLPKGTVLTNGLVLPSGTVAGAATMTDKMASFDGELDTVRYLGQVIGNPALPGGGGQAFGRLVNQAMQDGKVVVAVTQDVNNFFNPFTGKPGAYGKTPMPTFGVTWVHDDKQDGKMGPTQKDRRFFNFNTSDPAANQISTIAGRSIFAGERQMVPAEIAAARQELGIDKAPSGRRIMFGWVPEGKKVPDFVWEDDTARSLGGTNGQPVGTTWNFWLPVNPGPADISRLPKSPSLNQLPPLDNVPAPPWLRQDVTQPYTPGQGLTLAQPPLDSRTPAEGAGLAPGASALSTANTDNMRIVAQVGAAPDLPVTDGGPATFKYMNEEDQKLVRGLVVGYGQGIAEPKIKQAQERVWNGLTTAFDNRIGSPFANTPVGGAIIRAGEASAAQIQRLQTTLAETPGGRALGWTWQQTLGNKGFLESLDKFGKAATVPFGAAGAATISILANAALSGKLTVTSFKGTDPNLTPEQKEILKRSGLPRIAEFTAAYSNAPVGADVNNRAILYKASLPYLALPPGLPGQQGTAQTTAGLTPTGRVLVAPSAAFGGPTEVIGTMLGTENFNINNTLSFSGGSVGINPFLARLGQTMTVDKGKLKFSNPLDVGAAVSVSPYRLSLIGTANVGPVAVRARLVDPIFLTTDATTAGLVVKPTTRVTSVLVPQFSTSAGYNPNGKDLEAVRKFLEDIQKGGSAPAP